MKDRILSHLPGNFPWQVHWFNTIDSTNTAAKAMAAEGAPHGTVLVAGHQTSGRGRMGREFVSPQGKGIYLSVILRPDCLPTQLMHLTCAAGVAMCNAVEAYCGYRPGIKWINDLIANGKKLGGILTELSVDPATAKVRYAVVGIGINCSQRKEEFPESIREIAVSLETATGKAVAQDQLAAAMIQSLYQTDQALLGSKDSAMAQYRKDCITLGQEVRILSQDAPAYGTALDITDDGALTVQLPDGTLRLVNAGEVSLRGTDGYI